MALLHTLRPCSRLVVPSAVTESWSCRRVVLVRGRSWVESSSRRNVMDSTPGPRCASGTLCALDPGAGRTRCEPVPCLCAGETSCAGAEETRCNARVSKGKIYFVPFCVSVQTKTVALSASLARRAQFPRGGCTASSSCCSCRQGRIQGLSEERYPGDENFEQGSRKWCAFGVTRWCSSMHCTNRRDCCK